MSNKRSTSLSGTPRIAIRDQELDDGYPPGHFQTAAQVDEQHDLQPCHLEFDSRSGRFSSEIVMIWNSNK